MIFTRSLKALEWIDRVNEAMTSEVMTDVTAKACGCDRRGAVASQPGND
jgi:hypothetical protein